MRLQVCLSAAVLLVAALSIEVASAAEENPFDAPILDVRPRVFLRNDERFEGLTVQKLRQRAKTPEFADARQKWRAKPMGRAILWMLDGKQEDLQAAIAGLKKMDAAGGTWSDRGLDLIRLATLFDWLYPELDEPTRRAAIARIERAADAAAAHIRNGQAPFYYSRTPGALAGMTVAGIALRGVSDKAEGYLKLFREWGVGDYFKAYQWVDGAATGATYTFYYTYVDLPSIAAAWWSATGRNPQPWLRQNQGDWLDGIVRFYLWYMRPGFAFTDINDQSRDIWGTHDQFCQGLDIASYVTRNAAGREWSRRWQGKFGTALYHTEYAHNFIFRDPSLDASAAGASATRSEAPASERTSPKLRFDGAATEAGASGSGVLKLELGNKSGAPPLTALPHAALFGRESCGYGFFRSGWPKENEADTATHVFFRCGDPLDVHGGVSAGEFQVFRYAPLAARGGRYSSYDSPPDQYHRNCISTNVVLFTDSAAADDRGDQNTRRGLKSDHKTWAEWLAIRERNQLDVARITDWRVAPQEARCRADLSKTNPAGKCVQWIREFVWLADKHLVVLDIVETPKPEIRRQWQLHLPARPEIGDRIVSVVNRPPDRQWADPRLRPKNEEARLFCQTLLPADYRIILHSGGKAEAFDPAGKPLGATEGNPYHLKYGQHVVQIDPGTQSTKTAFLHVLTALDATQTAAPKATCRTLKPGTIEVTVGGATTVLAVPES